MRVYCVVNLQHKKNNSKKDSNFGVFEKYNDNLRMFIINNQTKIKE